MKTPTHGKTKARRLFRGATPPGVFQTMDIGFGSGHFLGRRVLATKNPRKRARNYLGVDEKIRSPTRYERLSRASNLELRIRPAEQVLEEIIAAGKRARHINIDMPNPIKMRSTIETVIRAAPQILFPNSKIFIASEDESVIAQAVAVAKKHGLRTQKMAELQRIQTPRGLIYPRRATAFMREYMRITGNPIYRIAITFTPKTARRFQREGKT